MNFYLGIDGGGTKTQATLIDETGRLVAESVGKASNPLRSSFAHAFTAIDDATARALATAGIEATEVRGVSAGLAGAGQARVAKRVAAFLTTRFREAEIEALTDLEIALETISAEGAAVVVAAGTGSAAFGRDGAGRAARAGGWGPWFSDEGSAFDIGRGTLAALAQAHDAGTPPGAFEKAVAASLGADDWTMSSITFCAARSFACPAYFRLLPKRRTAATRPRERFWIGRRKTWLDWPAW
jgi:N-acetylglucosamine kinase-like BadF-type ATPase